MQASRSIKEFEDLRSKESERPKEPRYKSSFAHRKERGRKRSRLRAPAADGLLARARQKPPTSLRLLIDQSRPSMKHRRTDEQGSRQSWRRSKREKYSDVEGVKASERHFFFDPHYYTFGLWRTLKFASNRPPMTSCWTQTDSTRCPRGYW